MALMHWDPFAAFERLDRVFDDLFWYGVEERPRHYLPGVDLTTEGTDAVISMELPGVGADEINIEVANGQLTISGERRDTLDREQSRLLARELHYGTFQRRFRLPEGVTADRISAELDSGVLRVRVKDVTQPPEKPRKIPVWSAGGKKQIEGHVVSKHAIAGGD